MRYYNAFKRAQICLSTWDWIETLLEACTIFCDPPYLGKGGFTTYTAAGWRMPDAVALGEALGRLKGCRVVLCEQESGGGPVYAEKIGADRPTFNKGFSRLRNVTGAKKAKRVEVTIIAPRLVSN